MALLTALSRFCHSCGSRSPYDPCEFTPSCVQCGNSELQLSPCPPDASPHVSLGASPLPSPGSGSDLLRPIIRAYEFGDMDDEIFVSVVTAALSVSAGVGIHSSLLNFLGASGKPVCRAYMQRMPVVAALSELGQCPICAQAVKIGNLAVSLPCSHAFHSACITRWFSLNHTCPVCRFPLATDDAKFYESIGETGLAYAAELDQLDVRRQALNDALDALKTAGHQLHAENAELALPDRPGAASLAVLQSDAPNVPELPYFAAEPLTRRATLKRRKFPPQASIPRRHASLPPVQGRRLKAAEALAISAAHLRLTQIFMNGIKWLPLESNPEVLTEYASSLGLKSGFAFQDVLAFEAWAVEMLLAPVKAAVFLYPVSLEEKDQDGGNDEPGIFFTKQTVGNACGTIALLHALGNNPEMCEENSYAAKFVEKTKDMRPDARGNFLEQDPEIATLHKAVETAGQSKPAEEEDPESDLHFITFVEKSGNFFCLDGRTPAPLLCGPVENGNFLLTVAEYVNRKFAQKHPDELHFSLIALAPSISD